jgi:hypothetical protein
METVSNEPNVEISDCDPNPGSDKCRLIKVSIDKARPSGNEIDYSIKVSTMYAEKTF